MTNVIENENENENKNKKNIIEVKNLYKSFGKLSVLENVNIDISEGEIISIIGMSGCGKSVFLRCLELLEKPDKGIIKILGDEITKKGADIDKIRMKMGMVYQNFNLFTHMDVLDNLIVAPVKLLKMDKEEAVKKAKDLLKQVGLLDKIYEMPENLSGGQKQRIAICRSLMMNPKILLFDEPTSALDPTMVGEVLATIRMLSKRNLTMIIVTHELNFAKEVSTRVLYFDNKGICEEGLPDEIFNHPKNKKTKDFINKVKSLQEHITNKNFDLMNLQGNIYCFAEKYGLSEKEAHKLQICTEELIYEYINHYKKDDVDILINFEYSDALKQIKIIMLINGEEYNPFDIENNNDLAVHLGVTIVEKTAKEFDYKYEGGTNRIYIVM